MKNIICLLSILFVAGWTGCGEEDGNTPSVAKDLKVFPGKYRAMLEFAAPADAKSYKLFYNNGEYLENPVSGTGGTQSIIVDGLSESEQVLRVVMLGENGIISDPKGIKVNIYGDNYQSKLKPRQLIDQSTPSSTSVELIFAAAEKDETGVYLVFTNTSGVLDSVHIGATQTVLNANNINLDEPYYFYSVYKPEADAIDDFPSATVDAQNAAMFNFEKEKWTIAGFSDQEPGGDGHWGLASSIIDDDVTTFWHSQVVGAQPPMPHWITVDMQSEKKFSGFYFVQTQDMSESGLAKGFRFEISSDNNTWTNVLEGEFTTTRARQEFAFAQQVTARYFKITILSGYLDAFWSQFAEIDLYNELNVSGMNGSIALDVLVNAKRPFQGENPLWGDRMQQLVGWTHNPVDIVSFATDEGTTMIMFS
ncbi:MAG: discoidin domain-containing protein, partial [Dysgonamonadaceae bacterium]|nr:discoidin domain-containing protein [Dysgonamonadaceae bacterium]